LLGLLPHALSGSDAAVTLEVFDDVAFDFQAGSPKSVLQVHHSTQGDRELLDTSAKTWRTLAIWAQEWKALEVGDTRVMTLVTTQRARPDSALEALTESKRDVERALATLVTIAEGANGASGTAADRAVFLELDSGERLAFLGNVTVADGALQATDVRARLVELLAPTHEHRFVESMVDLVEGWWWPKAVAALAENRSVRADEARVAIDEARRSLSDRALPILHLEDFDPGELPDLDPLRARFVLCLRAIAASGLRIAQAQDDYQRAFAHRSRWARRGLLGPQEYERYEDDLLSQWRIAVDRMLRVLQQDAASARLASAGHDLWDAIESDVRQPLRPETADGFIQRGSLHQLAEDERVAWHPTAARGILESRGRSEGAA
jgi:hypothetical protein